MEKLKGLCRWLAVGDEDDVMAKTIGAVTAACLAVMILVQVLKAVV